MAGLWTGRSPGFPCRAVAGNHPARWKPCWHETDFVALWGVGSALSVSDSAPWVARDMHKRPCQISFLFDLMHFGITDLLRSLWAAAWVAAEWLGQYWQVLYQCITTNCFLKKTVLFLSGCGAAQVHCLWDLGLIKIPGGPSFGKAPWHSSAGKKSSGKTPLTVQEHPLEGRQVNERQVYLRGDVVSVHRWWKLCPRSGRNQFLNTSI